MRNFEPLDFYGLIKKWDKLGWDLIETNDSWEIQHKDNNKIKIVICDSYNIHFIEENVPSNCDGVVIVDMSEIRLIEATIDYKRKVDVKKW